MDSKQLWSQIANKFREVADLIDNFDEALPQPAQQAVVPSLLYRLRSMPDFEDIDIDNWPKINIETSTKYVNTNNAIWEFISGMHLQTSGLDILVVDDTMLARELSKVSKSVTEHKFGIPLAIPNNKFNLIVINDVIDHFDSMSGATVFLEHMRSLLSNNGVIFIRTHPYSSRHGAIRYNFTAPDLSYRYIPGEDLAFLHCILSKEELNSLQLVKPSLRISAPISQYNKLFKTVNLVSYSDVPHTNSIRLIYDNIEPFFTMKFTNGKLIQRIRDNMVYHSRSVEDILRVMRISFVDYWLAAG